MCGICGFTGKIENREEVLKRMTEVITHRGPDSDGYFADDYINMGFRRLSIIDLDAGHSPSTTRTRPLSSPLTARFTTTRSCVRS